MKSKRGWLQIGVGILVVILLIAGGFALYRFVGWEWLAELPGIQMLLGQFGGSGPSATGNAASKDEAAQLVQEGASLEKEGRYRQALQVYERARELAPDEPVVYLALASVHETLGDVERALAQLRKAAELDPDSAVIQRYLGRLQCRVGDTERCIATLEHAVEMEPDDPLNHYFLAIAYQENAGATLSRAFDQFEETLELNPDLGEAHYHLGLLHRSQPGSEALALESFYRALQVAVDTEDDDLAAKVHAELASLYTGWDNFTRCIESWEEVLKRKPDDSDAHRRLGLCYAMRGEKGDLEKAVIEMEQALVRDFDQIDAYYYFLGKYYALERGDHDRAAWALEQFMRLTDNEQLKSQVEEWIEQGIAEMEDAPEEQP